MSAANLPSGPAYSLTTSRLVLRCIEPTDAPAFRALVAKNQQRLALWGDTTPFQTLPGVISWARRLRGWFDVGQVFCFSVLLHGQSEPIGFGELDPRHPEGGFEISGWFDADASGKGYATEATGALMKLAFELYGARRVEMYCDPDNLDMQKLSRRLGYQHEASFRRRIKRGGEPRDRMLWTVHDCDWPTTAPAALELLVCDVLGQVIYATDPAPRPPPGAPWGRDATTWDEAKRALSTRFALTDAGGDSYSVTLRFSPSSGPVEQVVMVVLAEVLGEPSVVVCSDAGTVTQLGLRAALEHNLTLAAGALTLGGDNYILRQTAALAGLTGRQLERLIGLVGHEAARLRSRPEGGTDEQLAAWWADSPDDPTRQ